MTSSLIAEVVTEVMASLGEGPAWIAKTQTLVWIDVLAGVVHLMDEGGRGIRDLAVGQDVSAALPIDSGILLLAVRDGFCLLAADGTTEPILSIPHADRPMRMNDAKSDPLGRVFNGSMHDGGRLGMGALYRLDDGPIATVVAGGVSVSNGLGWSPDLRRMYYVDSPTKRLDIFDYDAADGALTSRRALMHFDCADAVPDGLCVDDTGRSGSLFMAPGRSHGSVPREHLTPTFGCPATSSPAVPSEVQTGAHSSSHLRPPASTRRSWRTIHTTERSSLSGPESPVRPRPRGFLSRARGCRRTGRPRAGMGRPPERVRGRLASRNC